MGVQSMPVPRTAIIALAIAIIIVVGLGIYLATRGPSTTTTTATTAPGLKKVTLTIEYCAPHRDLFKPAIEEFKKKAKEMGYDVEVNEIVIPYGVDCAKRITEDLASGTAGDIVDVDSFMLASYAEAGYLYPLNDFIKNWPDWEKFAPAMRKIVEYKGKIYGVMIDTDVRMIWYRKDIFKLCGIPVPWQPKSWEDIIKTALKLKECEPKIKEKFGIKEFYPLIIPAGLKWGEATPCQGFWMLLVGADKEPLNRLYDYQKGKWICKSTALWRAFKFYIDVYVKYKIGNNDVNLAQDPWAAHRKAMSEGISAIDIGGSWEFYEAWGPEGIAPLKQCLEKCGCGEKCTTDEQKECYIKCEWEIIGFAKMPGYKGGAEGEREFVTISGGWAVAINAKLKNDPEKLKLAWLFITIAASRDIEAKYAAKFAKPCPRLDAVEVPEYAKDPYIKAISEYLKFTDYRDALPEYPKVSKIIQQVTQLIIEGKITDPDKALDEYCKRLKEELGPDKVIEYPVKKE